MFTGFSGFLFKVNSRRERDLWRLDRPFAGHVWWKQPPLENFGGVGLTAGIYQEKGRATGLAHGRRFGRIKGQLGTARLAPLVAGPLP